MRKYLIPIILFGSLLLSLIRFPEIDYPPQAYGATITRGITFGSTDQVTAAKLHQLVDSATLSSIVGSDITAATITADKLAANGITSNQVAYAGLDPTNFPSRVFDGHYLKTNAVTGIELSTNINYRTGFYNYTATSTNENTYISYNSTNTYLSFTNATLGFGAGQIPSAAVAGQGFVTSLYLKADVAVGAAYVNLLTWTNNQTTGMVGVNGNAMMVHNNNTLGAIGGRILEVNFPSLSTTNVIASAVTEGSVNTEYSGGASMSTVWRVAAATNIYVLQGAANAASGNWVVQGATGQATTFAVTNGNYLSIYQRP